MASLASTDQSRFSPSLDPVPGNPQKTMQNSTETPVRSSNKPRTRSAILRASQESAKTPGTPKKRNRKGRKSRKREESPVIDLTLDEAGLDEHSGDDSPLKRASKKAKDGSDNSSQTSAEPQKPRQSSRVHSAYQFVKPPETPGKVAASDQNTPNHTPSISNDTQGPEITALVPPHAGSDEENEENEENEVQKEPLSIPQLIQAQITPAHQHEDPDSAEFLNSSPVKKQGPTLPHLDLRTQIHATAAPFSSSPTKKSKTVAFSDAVVHDGSSSPTSPKGGDASMVTPRKSILKPWAMRDGSSPADPNNSHMWVKTTHTLSHQFSTENHSPSNPLFWQPGTIIQLEAKSHDLPQLVDGCVEVLKDEKFDKKFEVYATLLLVCRSNDASTVMDLFSGESSAWLTSVERTTGYKPRATPAFIKSICAFAKRDMESIESKLYVKEERPNLSPVKNNPFESRTLTQTLKLMGYFLAVPSINTQIPAAEVKWFYSHACDMIVKPILTKSLVSPYLSIIKDCHFPAKKRRLIFESHPNAVSEKMLFAILNMKNYLSSSLINERFIALRNLIQNFPAISAKHFHNWFPGLLVNLCDVSFVLYSKVVGTGITTLLEAARNYLDNNDICFYTRKFIESPLTANHRSWVTESLFSSSIESEQLALDYVVDSLKSLIDEGYYKSAMDIWVGVTLLLGKHDNGIDNWRHLGPWLSVHKSCFSVNSMLAKETALSSWKVMVYKICCHDLKDARLFSPTPLDSPGKSLVSPSQKANGKTDEILRSKIRLLIQPFTYITNFEMKRELVEGLHNCFLAIIYNLLGSQPKLNVKYMQTIWDKIIQPVLVNFYFKRDHSSPQMHQLGVSILNRLLRPSSPGPERAYSAIRCLSHEPISLSEIGSLNSRWMYLRFEKVLPVVSLAFKSKYLGFGAKCEVLLCFLDSIRNVTRKDVKLSDTTFDLIDNMPVCMDALLADSKVSYEPLNKVILTLNETFGAPNLVSMTEDTKSVVEPILAYGLRSLTHDQAHSIIGMWYSSIGDKKNLRFLSILDQVNQGLQREGISAFIAESLNSKKTSKFSLPELVMIGQMFQAITQDFTSIAKRIIQQIVLLKTEEFENMIVQLGVVKWNLNIFNFFVVLMHDAPYEHLKQATMNLIQERAANIQDFRGIVEVLLTHRFDFEIFYLRKQVVSLLKVSIPQDVPLHELWTDYIKGYDADVSLLDDILLCAFQEGLDINNLTHSKMQELPKLGLARRRKEECKPSETCPENDAVNSGAEEGDNCEPILSECASTSAVDHSNGDSRSPELGNESPVEHQQEGIDSNTSHKEDDDSFCIDVSSEDITESSIEKSSKEDRERIDSSENNAPTIASKDTSSVKSLDLVSDEIDSSNQTESIAGRKRKCTDASMDSKKRLHIQEDDFSTQDTLTNPATVRDVKQVSDSDESCREKTDGDKPDPGIEITSSSEEKERANQETPQSDLIFQGQSTANNTADDSRGLVTIPKPSDNECASAALATVEENTEDGDMQLMRQAKATALHEIFNQFDDCDLAMLTDKEQYDLETQMMHFMLRMREASSNRK